MVRRRDPVHYVLRSRRVRDRRLWFTPPPLPLPLPPSLRFRLPLFSFLAPDFVSFASKEVLPHLSRRLTPPLFGSDVPFRPECLEPPPPQLQLPPRPPPPPPAEPVPPPAQRREVVVLVG